MQTPTKHKRGSGLPRPTASGRSTPSRAMSRESLVSIGSVTDEWSVGERCYVGGTKLGKVAFIGETKFASGDWIGVSLDEPNGKNDGMVTGVRYFTCPANHGLFCRPSKLSRNNSEGLVLPMINLCTSTPKAPESRTTDAISPPMTPMSDRDPLPTIEPQSNLLETSQLNTSSLSISENSARLDIGERVIVSGTKHGFLRFMGDTDFAKGIWCGVELDTAIGKNDGSVQGKRFFHCKPMFGLFAPLSRVVREPRQPTNVRGRNHGALAAAGVHSAVRRTIGSQESLSSIGSSASRRKPLPKHSQSPDMVGIQESVMAEKEQHIEQLLKERDLERADMTRLVQQKDALDQELRKLRLEFNELTSKIEIQKNNLTSTDNDTMVALEEEKKKTEDLGFQLDEKQILLEEAEAKYIELEETLKASGDSALVSMEQKHTELQSEISDYKQRIQKLQMDWASKESDSVSRVADLERLLADTNQSAVLLKNEISEKVALFEEKEKIVAELRNSLEERNGQCESLIAENESLLAKSSQSDQKIEVLESEKLKFVDQISTLEFTKRDLEVRLVDNSGASADQIEMLNNKDGIISGLQNSLSEANSKLQFENKALTVLKTKADELEKALNDSVCEMEMVRSKSQETIKVLEQKVADLESNYLESEKGAKEISAELANEKSKNDQLAKSATELTDTIQSLETASAETNSQFEIKISTLNTELIALRALHEDLQKSHSDVSAEKDGLAINAGELRAQISTLTDNIQTRKQELLASEATISELQQKVLESSSSSTEQMTLLDEKQKKISNLESTMQNEKSIVRTLTEAVKVHEAKLVELNLAVTERDENLGNLNQQLATVSNDLSRLKVARDELEALHLATKSDKEQLSIELDDLKGKAKHLTDGNDALKTELAATKLSVSSLEQKLAENSGFTADQLGQLQDKDKKIVDLEKQLCESNNTREKLDDQLESLNKRVIQLTDLTKDKDTTLDILNLNLTDQTAALRDLSARHDELQTSFTSLQTANDANANECAELKTKLATSTEMNSALKVDVESSKNSVALLEKQIAENSGLSTDQLAQLDNKQKKITELEFQLEATTSQAKIVELSLQSTSATLKTTETKMEELFGIEKTLKAEIETLKAQNSKGAEKHGELSVSLTDLASQKQVLEAQLVEKENSILNSQNTIATFQENLKTLEQKLSDSQTVLSKCQEELQSRDSDISRLNQESVQSKQELDNHVRLVSELKDSQHQLSTNSDKLEAEKQLYIIKLETELTSTRDQISYLTAEVDVLNVLKSNNEQLKSEVESLKEMKAMAIDEVVNRMTAENEQLKSDLIDSKNQFEQVQQLSQKRLFSVQQDAQTELGKLQQQIDSLQGSKDEDNSRILSENADLHSQIDKLKSKQKILSETALIESNNKSMEVDQLREKLQSTISNHSQAMDKRELVLHAQFDDERIQLKDRMLKLENVLDEKDEAIFEFQRVSSTIDVTTRAKLDQLETEKFELQEKIIILETQLSVKESHTSMSNGRNSESDADTISTTPDSNNPNLLQQQIDFLNSVIADLHGKLTHKDREIEVLRKNVIDFDLEDELNMPKLDINKRPPRMYCDICEEFDVHETDDCPTQQMDLTDVETHSKFHAPRHTARPYCDNCEAFGHETEKCDAESEMY